MKAAVLHEGGGVPRYEEFAAPVAGEVIVDVKAVAVENVDKMVAAARHYASGQYLTQLPAIPASTACWISCGAVPPSSCCAR